MIRLAKNEQRGARRLLRIFNLLKIKINANDYLFLKLLSDFFIFIRSGVYLMFSGNFISFAFWVLLLSCWAVLIMPKIIRHLHRNCLVLDFAGNIYSYHNYNCKLSENNVVRSIQQDLNFFFKLYNNSQLRIFRSVWSFTLYNTCNMYCLCTIIAFLLNINFSVLIHIHFYI